MAVVHIHIERTGGVSLQALYEKKYPGTGMLWYSVRDDLFAPFSIKTAIYAKDWQLKPYAFLARRFPKIRHFLVRIRIFRRKRQAVPLDELSSRATVVTGHFAVNKVLPYLPSDQHEYRTVIRDPLDRMWSHFNYFRAHKGDVGHRVVPTYHEDMMFEEFALLPEMINYQTQAIGEDLSIYKHIGITEKLDLFCKETGLISDNTVCVANSFKEDLPILSVEFIETFKTAHALDYALYNSIAKKILEKSTD